VTSPCSALGGDPAWPQPVWGVLIEGTDDGLVRLIWRRDRKDDG
jgi:hypothetical protein